ncbi:MAG: NAD-dependent epimerase/dehydratase family protein [bacterium]|nr:NAD-dependent epimerase/dehydratase family protein [bacterium]
MNCLVTGAAGFIGSNICQKLLSLGHQVIGIDSFLDYYPRKIKEANIYKILSHENFRFIEADINYLYLDNIFDGVNYIFHLAAQAGVRDSWGKDFSIYINSNIHVTQKLLEHCLHIKSLKKFIYASSSSIYGDTNIFPITEEAKMQPTSPYGASKLLGENLCYLYWKSYNLPVISLRFFTVFGPKQRPDMAFHKFIKAALNDQEIVIYGDGEQTRDFTYIDDIVDANMLSMESDINGEAFNIGGGARISLIKTIHLLQEIIGKEIKIKYVEKQRGDMLHTYANLTKAKSLLKYNPCVPIKNGLEKEVDWIKNNLKLLTNN